MLRLFGEPEANERAFTALTRFLDVLDETVPRDSRPAARPARALVPAEAPLARRLPAASDELRRVRRPASSSASRPARAARSARCTGPVRCDCRRKGSQGSSSCSRRRSRTRSPPSCPTGLAATRSRSSRRRTRSTEDSASGRSRHERRHRTRARVDRPGAPDRVKRQLADELELDDDKERIDRTEVHRFLCDESYWAAGRPRETQDRLIDDGRARRRALRRRAPDRLLPRGDGRCLVRLPRRRLRARRSTAAAASARHSCARWSRTARSRHLKWLLHTTDMHPLYRKFGFDEPSSKVMERVRPPRRGARRATRATADSGR